MKVLTVVFNLGPGGTQRVAQNYAVGYAAAGFGSAVLAYREGGPRVAELQARGIETFVGDEGVAAAAAWGADVVHVHREGGPDSVLADVLAALRSAGSNASWVETNVFSRADATEVGQMFDLHFQLSRWCLWKWARRTQNLQPRPLGVVMPYAVDAEAFYPDPEGADAFRRELGVPPDAVLIGRIGQPLAAKWMPGLARAFETVASDDPRAHLLLVGYPDAFRAELDALPTEIRARVHELPFLHGDDVLRAAFSALDVFAHSAHKGESFGMVLVESMLCGTPVVTRSRPARDNSQVEVVGHGVGGLVAADDAGFAEALAALVSDPERRAQLGRTGAEQTRRRYHIDHVMPEMIAAIQAVRESDSRSALVAQLHALGLTTSVSTREVWESLRSAYGRTPLRERALAALVDQPLAYGLWHRLRG